MPAAVDLQGKRVLVIGGSGVLGFEIATELRRNGATVMLAGRDPSRLQQRATEIGPDVPSVVFDLTIDGHIEHVIATASARMGGIDGVVNAAGVVAFGPLQDLEPASLEQIFTTNLIGPLKLVSALIPQMPSGFIVNLSGVVAETPMAGMVVYSAAKAGLSAATVALGRELRRQGIHVLDVRPPHTETGLTERAISGTAPKMPAGLEPGHVARTVVAGLKAGKRELAGADFAQS